MGDVREEEGSSTTRPLIIADGGDANDVDGASATLHQSNDDMAPMMMDGLPVGTSILLKSLYFLDALGASTWGRYATLFYNQKHLNSAQIGLIQGLMPIVRTFSQPAWGIVADQYHCRKIVYLVTQVGSTLILLSLALPWVGRTFGRMLAVTIASQLFVSSGLLDSYTLDLLGTKQKGLYGRYRLYCSLSWGLGSILMGGIMDHYHGDFEPNFILFAVLSALLIVLVAWKVPNQVTHDTVVAGNSNSSDEHEQRELLDNVTNEVMESGQETTPQQQEVENNLPVSSVQEHGTVMDLASFFFGHSNVVAFLLETVIMGAAMATVETLLFLYLKNDLSSNTMLCGLSVGVNVLFELPIFWSAEWILQHLGHDGMMAVAMICFFGRVYGYTLLTPSTKYLILPLEATHGFTFALFWTASTDVTKALISLQSQQQTSSSRGWNTAIPMVVQTLYSSVGVGMGSTLGGWAMHHFGSRAMYRMIATIVACMFAIHVIFSAVCRALHGMPFLPDHPTMEEEETACNSSTGASNPTSDTCHDQSSELEQPLLENIP